MTRRIVSLFLAACFALGGPNPLSRAQDAKCATLRVTVPSDATVYVDGVMMKQTGAARSFVTPPLPDNDTYVCEVTAEVLRHGRYVRKTKKLDVRAGQSSTADFSDLDSTDRSARPIITEQPARPIFTGGVAGEHLRFRPPQQGHGTLVGEAPTRDGSGGTVGVGTATTYGLNAVPPPVPPNSDNGVQLPEAFAICLALLCVVAIIIALVVLTHYLEQKPAKYEKSSAQGSASNGAARASAARTAKTDQSPGAAPKDRDRFSSFREALGVPNGATQDDIKRAWRKKAMQFHPDRGGDAELFKKTLFAYEVLSGRWQGPQKEQRNAGEPDHEFRNYAQAYYDAWYSVPPNVRFWFSLFEFLHGISLVFAFPLFFGGGILLLGGLLFGNPSEEMIVRTFILVVVSGVLVLGAFTKFWEHLRIDLRDKYSSANAKQPHKPTPQNDADSKGVAAGCAVVLAVLLVMSVIGVLTAPNLSVHPVVALGLYGAMFGIPLWALLKHVFKKK